MNVLIISNLSGNLFAGPNNSVPAQVAAQASVDNVLWYNINHIKRDEWVKIGCKNLDDFFPAALDSLPSPFNRPDVAIVEELYCYPFSKILRDLLKYSIPYVIIPRSELTHQAQKKKAIKKKLGNFIYFSRIIKKSSAIHFLTSAEKNDSIRFNQKPFVIVPNGISIPDSAHNSFSSTSINATYIGRFEMYQKGLDILLDAISLISTELREAHFHINMYGVDQENTVFEMREIIRTNHIEDIVSIMNPVFGNEKTEQLKVSDVFIMTSRFEGMPMGMIEALSYGIPCIATNGTNLANEINEYEAGWVADNDKNSVSQALINCIRDKASFSVKSVNARKLAEKYSWDYIAQMTHKYLEEIVKKDRKTGGVL